MLFLVSFKIFKNNIFASMTLNFFIKSESFKYIYSFIFAAPSTEHSIIIKAYKYILTSINKTKYFLTFHTYM